MGNMVDTKKVEFVYKMMDNRYKDFYNNFIRKNGTALWEICQLISEGKVNEAEEKFREVYRKNNIDWEGRDNWFGYDLADKIIIYAGQTPKREE